MNSPLENRKVRLRGLGGQEVCGAPGTCASAATQTADRVEDLHAANNKAGRRKYLRPAFNALS
jgi:hypothetical protein